MLSLYEILKASKTGIAPDMWTALASGAKTREITGIPPLSIRSNGTMLLDYLISGNMTQTGTPTPTTPIQPSECGERTGNLVRFYQEEMQGNFYGVDITVKNAEITLNGTVSPGSGHWVEIGYKFGGGTGLTDNVVIPCEPETSYTITTEILDGNSSEVRKISFGTSSTLKTINIGSSLTTMFSADINRIFISLGPGGVVFNNLKFRVMFNKGSTALPYEPYGYKIPISSANTTTPVYLREVETTRKIKKLVLTGRENWQRTTNGAYYIGTDVCPNDYLKTLDKTIVVCTHYVAQKSVTDSSNVNDNCISFFGGSGSTCELYIAARDVVDVETFKSYLQQQYAAGTPVTVWYVLSEPTTGIVNEPLRKIGDHADTISYEQAGVQIPTNRGNTVIDVETTLKPSEMYIKYQE